MKGNDRKLLVLGVLLALVAVSPALAQESGLDHSGVNPDNNQDTEGDEEPDDSEIRPPGIGGGDEEPDDSEIRPPGIGPDDDGEDDKDAVQNLEEARERIEELEEQVRELQEEVRELRENQRPDESDGIGRPGTPDEPEDNETGDGEIENETEQNETDAGREGPSENSRRPGFVSNLFSTIFR